jgi:hypothetical protein
LSSRVASHLTHGIRPKIAETVDNDVALLKRKKSKRKKIISSRQKKRLVTQEKKLVTQGEKKQRIGK